MPKIKKEIFFFLSFIFILSVFVLPVFPVTAADNPPAPSIDDPPLPPAIVQDTTVPGKNVVEGLNNFDVQAMLAPAAANVDYSTMGLEQLCDMLCNPEKYAADENSQKEISEKAKAELQRRGKDCFCNPSPWHSIPELIAAFISKMFIILLVLASLMIVIGAFILMISAGSESRVKLGKDIIKWALIGLVVILMSRLVVSIVRKILAG